MALVRTELEATFDCPAERIELSRVSGPLYRVSGCGRYAVEHLCWSPGRGEMECRPVPPRAPVVAHRAPPPIAQIADGYFQSVSGPVTACGAGAISVTVEIARDGRVASVTGIEALETERQLCVMSALQSTSIAGGLPRASRARFTFGGE